MIGALNADSPIDAMGYGADGQLYGVSALGLLYRIDPTTLGTTLLGPIGSSVAGGTASGGVFTLTSFDGGTGSNLVTVAPPSPTGSVIGPMIDTSTNQGFTADGLVAYGPNGTLYVSGNNETVFNNSEPDNLYTVDPTTGAVTPIGPMGHFLYAGLFIGQDLIGITGDTNEIVSIDPTTGRLTDLAGIDIDPDASIGAVVAMPPSVPKGNSLLLPGIGAGAVVLAARVRDVVGRRQARRKASPQV